MRGDYLDVCVVLPTLNEADSIKDMVRRVRKASKDYEIYVVDSGSTDGTGRMAREAGATVISVGRGKGVAIKKAFSLLNSRRVVLLDSDSSYLPSQIPLLLRALEGCDAVVGSRFKGRIEKGAMKPLNRAGNLFLTWLAKSLYGIDITDVCSGFWAFNRKAYKKMEIDAPSFELEANFYVECARKGLKLSEVPITYRRRKGKTKLNILDGSRIGLYLVKKGCFRVEQVFF